MIRRWQDFDETIARMSDAEKRELIARVEQSLRNSSKQSDDVQTTIGHSLDEFIGDWTDEEADAFERAVQHCRKIDPELWQ